MNALFGLMALLEVSLNEMATLSWIVDFRAARSSGTEIR